MRTPIVLLVSAAMAACGAEQPEIAQNDLPVEAAESSPSFADPDVQRLHDAMMTAMDPEGVYSRSPYLAFSWIVQRAGGDPVARDHRWNRWTGDVRVEGPTDEGTLVASFNINDPDAGRIWLAGTEVTDERRMEWLGRAQGMHVNDSYWLVMPFKWADPGVTTRYLGEEADEDGNSWEVVELSFESVGRTPQNVYHAYINPTSGLMERWAHFRTRDADPFFSGWTEWTDFGGVKLPLDRPWADGGRIYFEGVQLSADVPTDAFTGPTT